MTPKDPFLEGTFWDKFWRPIRSRALLFTPEISLPSGAPGLHALLNYFGINFCFAYTYTYTFHCFGNYLQECNRSPLGLHLHSGDYTYTLTWFSS